MPIYEYHCRDCDAVFEKLVKTHAETVNCAKCGSVEVVRKLSTFAPPGTAPAGSCAQHKICPGAVGGACGHCCGGSGV